MADADIMGLVYPVKPGDWVQSPSEQIARVKSVYPEGDELLADLVLYSLTGERIGRASPAMGGPRTFEPACSLAGWERIEEPSFPIRLRWITNAAGNRVASFAADRAPPRQYRPPKRKATGKIPGRDDYLRRVLEQIADGHNDPRTLAKDALGRTRRA